MSHWILDDVVWEGKCEVQGNMLLKLRVPGKRTRDDIERSWRIDGQLRYPWYLKFHFGFRSLRGPGLACPSSILHNHR